MAARENEIGHCRCPICQGSRAKLRVSARGLAYVVCDGCNSQTFARGDRSDEHLRRLFAEPAPAAAAQPVEPEKPATAPAAKTEPTPQPTKAPAAPSAPAKPRMAWGAFPNL